VFHFDIEVKSKGKVGELDCPCGDGQSSYTVTGLQPGTPYYLRVCAVYDTNSVCSDENGAGYTSVTTQSVGPDSDTHPTPAITGAQPGLTTITISWTSFGHVYTKFYINYEQQAAPGAPRNHVYTNKVDDCSTDCTRTITGLPAATTWLISVQGCDFSFIQDACYDWSPVYPVTTTGRTGDEWRTRWQQLDDNAATVELCADGSTVYQRWSGGNIWQYTGTPTAWQPLDSNPGTVEIACGGGNLYQRHSNGEIYQYTGTPCDAAGNCFGWKLLDNNAATTDLCADGKALYQRWSNGDIWQYTGTPKAWQHLDDNPGTAQIACGGGHVYQRHGNGDIYVYTGKGCDPAGTCLGWQRLDDDPATTAIASGTNLYQLHDNGEIYQYTGKPCDAAGACFGWSKLDINPGTVQLAASGGNLYQRHGDGQVWKYTGTPCATASTCQGWVPLDDNAATVSIAAGDDDVYHLHNTGEIWTHLR